MHKEILTGDQKALLPLIYRFANTFGLVGGTAVALYLGHRRSIDFDLFTEKKFGNLSIKKEIEKYFKIKEIIIDRKGEYTVIVTNVKLTFYQYPYSIEYSKNLDKVIRLPDLLTLAAMKAHALGRRAKWKDYVDLYFIMKHYKGLDKIVNQAKTIFKQDFNEKLFRVQLAYFEDMDYSEKIVFMPGFEIQDSVLKNKLIEYSLS